MNAPVVEGPAYLQPYCTGDGERMYVYLVNGAHILQRLQRVPGQQDEIVPEQPPDILFRQIS